MDFIFMLRKLKNLYFTFKNKYFKKKHKDKSSDAGFDYNKKLVYSLSKSKIPTIKQLKYVGRYLSKKELFAIKISFLLIFISTIILVSTFYRNHLELIPVVGGSYTEGLVGAPKHINPLYANINDVDSDIASLVFSSLYKRNGKGQLEKDLVDTLSLSEDEKIYTIKIKDNVFWHDGEKLSSEDVIFTINTILDSSYQSSLRSSLSGVTVKKIDDLTLELSLSQAYAAFKDLLTFGIMPAHLWEQLSPESSLLTDLNIKPIGSGPYKFKRLLKEKASGRILYIELESNNEYYAKQAYIKNINFKFFPNFEELIVAINENTVDGIAYLPKELKARLSAQNSLNFHKLDLTQILSLSFNPKENSFLEKKSTRQALAYAIDKERIVQEVFSGDASVVDSPIVKNSFALKNDLKKYSYDKETAIELLEKDNWSLATISPSDLLGDDDEAKLKKKLGEGHWMTRENENKETEYLRIDISIINTPDNLAVAEKIKKYWQAVGIKTNIKEYKSKEMNNDIIPNRKYDALLYSQSLSFDPDVYAFWHSSQAVTGGNNIANYHNSEVDVLLSEARQFSDEGKRQELYFKFQELLNDEVPAIFISSPKYDYVQKKDIKNFNVTSISVPSDRFSNISDWYIDTGKKIIW